MKYMGYLNQEVCKINRPTWIRTTLIFSSCNIACIYYMYMRWYQATCTCTVVLCMLNTRLMAHTYRYSQEKGLADSTNTAPNFVKCFLMYDASQDLWSVIALGYTVAVTWSGNHFTKFITNVTHRYKDPVPSVTSWFITCFTLLPRHIRGSSIRTCSIAVLHVIRLDVSKLNVKFGVGFFG